MDRCVPGPSTQAVLPVQYLQRGWRTKTNLEPRLHELIMLSLDARGASVPVLDIVLSVPFKFQPFYGQPFLRTR